MPTVRKMPAASRVELDTIVAQLNLCISYFLGFDLSDAQRLGFDQLTAQYNDLLDLRTKLAAAVVDLGVLRTPIVASLVDSAATLVRAQNGTIGSAKIADGTTAGFIKSVAAIDFKIAGQLYSKGATDDLWDLSAKVDTDGTHYRAYWLYLDASGVATVAAGADALTSEALAIAALPALDATKAVIGVYVAGPSTDFNGVAGLDSYGTYINGYPSGYTATAASPAALTTSAPAALTTSITTGIIAGTVAGKLKLASDCTYEIGQTAYRKAATDNLWDLSAEVDTIAAKYRAYWLYLNTAGASSFDAQEGVDSTSSDDAIAALPTPDTGKAVVGIYVAGPSTDFNGGAGLIAQGAVYFGAMPRIPSGTLTAETITLVNP